MRQNQWRAHPGPRNAGIPTALLFLGLCFVGCGENPEETAKPDSADPGQQGGRTGVSPQPPMKKMALNPGEIVFKDNVESNAEVPPGLDGLVFVDTVGDRVRLDDYLGKKNVILVFTEGFAGMLCPFCMTQTSRLVANYEQFRALDTEVLVVYPGERDHLDEFIEAARTQDKDQVDRVPFPIVLDKEFQAVDFFRIRSQLAHPSTYIIDKRGNIKLAYVGADMSADRPSIQAMLDILKSLNPESE